MPLILGLGRRSNPYRAFGDVLYLSDYWSTGVPSAHEIDNLLHDMKRHQLYQCNFDIGYVGPDGTIELPDTIDNFIWECDEWSTKTHYPVRVAAWVRNGAGADLRSEVVMQRLVRQMEKLKPFKTIHFDFEFWAEEQGPHFARLLELVRREYPAYHLSAVARRPWLQWRGFADRLGGVLNDVEVALFDSAREGEEYAAWCAQVTDRALQLLVPDQLVLAVPAFHDVSERHPLGESMSEALRGIKSAVRRYPSTRVRLALYREGSATKADWRTFDAEWAR